MNTRGRCAALLFSVAVFVGGFGVPAGADLLVFSGELSDPSLPLSNFNTQIEYNFDPGTSMLEISLDNLTAPPPGFTLADVFMNTSDNVTGMALVGTDGFPHASLIAYNPATPSLTRADGFGFFDWTLDLGPGASGLHAGHIATFTLDVTGSGLTTDDFFTGLSWDATRTRSVGAVKFTEGEEVGHVYAIPQHPIVPEPATVTLLGLGASGLFLRLRRRRAN